MGRNVELSIPIENDSPEWAKKKKKKKRGGERNGEGDKELIKLL